MAGFAKTGGEEMSPSEIRIGNWLEHDDNWSYRQPNAAKIFEFQWDDRDWYALGESTLFLESISPIELTEEWLTKFGFVNDGICWSYGLVMLSETKDGDFNVFYGTLTHGLMTIRISTVHQLQNFIYATTGTELTIKE